MTKPSWIASVVVGVVAMTVAACGGDSNTTPPADARIDATPAVSHYGVCTMGVPADCPAGDTCQVRGVPNGSTTMGYCSPPCTTSPECAAGYTGPGTATCFMPDVCIIVCLDVCPDGLTCMDTGGGPVKVCAVPAP